MFWIRREDRGRNRVFTISPVGLQTGTLMVGLIGTVAAVVWRALR